MTVNVIGQRMNFLVIIHGCWLVAILVRRRRAAIAKIWPRYCLFLSVFMIYQYLLCVGIPPAICRGESRDVETQMILLSQAEAFFNCYLNGVFVSTIVTDKHHRLQ